MNTFSEENFDTEVLESTVPVLVDFWSPSCGPCKTMEPIVAEVAKEFEGKVRFGKVDASTAKEIIRRYFIRGVPTMMMFENGGPVGKRVGLLTKQALTEFVQSTLEPK